MVLLLSRAARPFRWCRVSTYPRVQFSGATSHLILQAVAGISDLVGIALDTLRQFSGGSSNDEQVIKLTIAGATEVALRTGAYVVLPHHTGKQNYRDGVADMYCGSGSAAIADNCRFVLLLQTTTWGDIESKVRRVGPRARRSTRAVVDPRQPAHAGHGADLSVPRGFSH